MAQRVKEYSKRDPLDLPLLGSELVCVIEPARPHLRVPAEIAPEPLFPASRPASGEQYRFHFDMTKCIGCKCCVVACNEQNGNPAAINWRRVGELEGGYYPAAQRHHLSMGCNHCLEPSCLAGCPVEAYTKDPATGVVLHSAETCIGCQYCTWNCSYGVPQFNKARGVVGKCDLCHNRLADGMAPACVAACPEGAISIEIVNIAEWRRDYWSADAPGLPPAENSISTTRITLPPDLSPDAKRVDTGRLTLEPPHWPLVFMLTLTQMAGGAFAALYAINLLGRAADSLAVAAAALMAAIGLGAATLHLGRPIHAMRALKGLRRSWLSREVLGLSLFAGAAAASAAVSLMHLPNLALLEALTAIFAAAGMISSARIYMVPARPAWDSRYTMGSFFATATVLGLLFLRAFDASGSTASLLTRFAVAGAGVQLLTEALKFLWLARSEQVELRASAMLLSGRLRNWFLLRLALLIAAGVALPLASHSQAAALAALILAFGGELAGRWLFFVSVTPLSIASAFLGTEKAA